MKVFIRYYKQDSYGTCHTLAINVANQEQFTFWDLKQQIQQRLRIHPIYQQLSIRDHVSGRQIMPIENDSEVVSLKLLEHSTRPQVFLETPEYNQNPQSPKQNQGSSYGDRYYKYFERLGILGQNWQESKKEEEQEKVPSAQDIFEIIAKLCSNQCSSEAIELIHLHKGKIDLNGSYRKGWTLLHIAGYFGEAKLITELLHFEQIDPQILSEDQWTPLHLSAQNGNNEAVLALIRDKRVNINFRSPSIGTPLHCACSQSHSHIVQILLMYGANNSITDADGKRPSELAIDQNVLKLFEKYDAIIYDIDEELSNVEAQIFGKIDPDSEKLLSCLATDLQTTTNMLLCEEGLENLLKLVQTQVKIKGTVNLQGGLIINSRRYFYALNPLEGTLVRYASQQDYPNKPKKIISLTKIFSIKRKPNNWLTRRAFHYFEITHTYRSIFFTQNERVTNIWVECMNRSKIFYQWLCGLSDCRYSKTVKPQIVSKIDSMLDAIMQTPIPEVDLDKILDAKLLSEEQAQINSKRELQISQLNYSDLTMEMKPQVEKINEETGNERESRIKQPREEIKEPKAEVVLSVEERKDKLMPAPDSMRDMSKSMKVIKQEIDTLTGGEQRGIVSFKDFRILETIGAGTFGRVMKVEKRGSNKIFAMKMLRKAFLYKNRHLKYAVSECNILKQLDHPFIVKLYFAFQTPQNLYLILDYCPGGDLSLHLARRELFEEHQAKFFIAELVLAIEYLHSIDIIYRDLKPENILIDTEGHIKLADFGLAKDQITGPNSAKSFCGSPAYLPPEMLKKAGVGKAADIYGIGAVLYELLTGIPPYYEDNISKMYENIRSADLAFPNYFSRVCVDLIRKLLIRDPNKRLGAKGFADIKSHRFFKQVNWSLLQQRKIKPPIILGLSGESQDMRLTEEEKYFLIESRGSPREQVIKDKDYTDKNALVNRVKRFTFVRDQQQ